VEANKREKEKKPWWILSVIGLFLITKGKTIFTIFKFSKFGGVIISMLVSIGAYAILFPLGFAIGLVVMILIHELGHVMAAKRKGLPVSAPLFIPFIGALITMKKHPRDAVTEAYIAFGGPILGTLGALVTFWLGVQLNNNLLIIIANVGFFINLLNLLPIHPLDGGRISTAVTRWLWLVGLIGGLVVIYYLQSILFFIIWALFAWEMYQKYVKNKDGGKPLAASCQIEVPLAYLEQNGMMIPGEAHKRDLSFETYSTLDGQQKVVVQWESLGINQTVRLHQQGLIRKVHVTHIDHVPQDMPTKLIIHCRIEYVQYENDKYYDVPIETRWKYGAAYVALALFLGYMLYVIAELNIQPA
jgi:Zn-dependent protease